MSRAMENMKAMNDFCNVRVVLSLCVGMIIAGCGEQGDSASKRLISCAEQASVISTQARLQAEQSLISFLQNIEQEADVTKVVTNDLVQIMRGLPLAEMSYATRLRSLNEYSRLVATYAIHLKNRVQDEESVWRFKLKALDRINEEIRRCQEEPEGGVFGDVSAGGGPFLMRKRYLEQLADLRFQYVREGFEYGDFTRFFYVLPPERQCVWLNRLEKMARRKVVVWDPNNQMIRMPTNDSTSIPPRSRLDVERSSVEQLGNGLKLKMWSVK